MATVTVLVQAAGQPPARDRAAEHVRATVSDRDRVLEVIGPYDLVVETDRSTRDLAKLVERIRRSDAVLRTLTLAHVEDAQP